MRRFLFFVFLSCFLTGFLYAQDDDSSCGASDNFFIPDFIFTLTPRSLTENSAVSLLGEVGRWNYRFNGTFGVLAGDNKLFKVSGEFLQQKISYQFLSGKSVKWMRQYAVGAAYRHLSGLPVLTDFEFGGYFSCAPGRNLHSKVYSDMELARHIAGSSSYGFRAGFGISPWPWTRLHIDADYDTVIYKRSFLPRKYVEGFGGSFDFYQRLFANVSLGLQGEFRRPYNYYAGALNWLVPNMPGLSIGIFGSHTTGKSCLPSCTTAGLMINYILAQPSCCAPCDEASPSGSLSPAYFGPIPLAFAEEKDPLLKAWVTDPAVYIPEVLAIAEQSIIPVMVCRGPPTSSSIPNQSFCGSDPYEFAVSSFFSNEAGGGPLTFSAAGLPAGSTINSSSGVISGPTLQDNSTHAVTVTGTNICGETSQSFTISFPCTAPTSSSIPNQSFCGSDPYSFDVSSFFSTGGQCGGGPLTFSATGLPAGSTINSSSGVISGPTLQDNSTHAVTVTGTNICGQTSQGFTISFPCTAPTSTAIPNQSFCGPNPYSFDVSSFFSTGGPCGGGPLTFSATGLPAGSTIDSSTGVISGPNLQNNSTHLVTVTGTNVCGQTSQNFTISFPCLAPTSVTLVPNFVENPPSGSTFNLAQFYTSPCGQPFTFSLTGNIPPNASINPVTGVLNSGTFQPSGTFTFNVVGTTTCGSTSQPFTIRYQTSQRSAD